MSERSAIVEILPEHERGPFLDAIEEAIGLGTYVWEPARGRVAWSPGFFRLVGIAPGPVPSLSFFDRVHPEDRVRVATAWQTVPITGRVESFAYRLLDGDTVRWVVGRGTTTRDAAGAVERVIGTIVDVTAGQVARDHLADALDLLTVTQRAAGVGTYVYEVESHRLTWSDELRRIAGLPADAAVTPATPVELAHPEDRARLRAWGAEILEQGTAQPLLARLIRTDGALRYAEWRARRVDRHGVAVIIGVGMDVTERVELEQELRHAAKMEAVGTLAAGVAHDFNNYLTVLSMQIEALRVTMRPTAEDLTAMIDAVDRCAGLVRQLLAFARRQPFRPRRVDLAEQVRGVVSLFQRAAAPGLDVDLSASGALPVHGDPAQLDGAVMNLLVNARDAMAQGGTLRVSVDEVTLAAGDPRLEDRLAPGRFAHLRVRDDGHGIAPEVLPRIFEPYFTTKAAGGGSGLGLASVYGTVLQHDGAIDVASELGKGTTFDVYLPIEERPAGERAPSPPPPAPGRRVLVVDDIEPVRAAIALLLAEDGYDVVEASDGEEALARARAGERFDVVLSDIVMPRLDGRALARELATLVPGLPVILMSGYTDRLDGDDAIAVRLDKPFSRDQLHAALARVLGQRES